MPEPGKSDRWNSVLESLGVPVSQPDSPPPTEKPAEAPAAKQPVSMLPPQKQKPAPKPKSGPAPAKSPSYWSRIAGALGLEVPSAPEPPAAEEAKVEHRGEPVAESLDDLRREPATQPEPPTHRHAAPQRRDRELPPRAFDRPAREGRPPREERRPRHERPSREERPPREERPRHETAPRAEETPSSLNEMFGAKPRDLDVFSLGESPPPRVREPAAREADDDERGSVLDYDLPLEGGSDLSLEKNAPGTFEAETSGDEGGGRRRRRRRGRGRGRRGGGPARESAPPAHEADIEPAGEEADFDFERDDELELELERAELPDVDQQRQPAGGRRHRDDDVDRYPPAAEREQRGGERVREERGSEERGGRGRRRRSSERDREAFGADRPPRGGDVQRGGPPRSQAAGAMHAAEPEFDDDLTGDVDDEADSHGDLPTHKKIPTWDEAVAMLIEANMANRGPDRDRDRGYGRGRGGRGRG